VDVVTDPSTGGRKGSKLARFDMIPPDVLWELAEHYGRGEAIYPSDPEPNWQRGYSWRLSVAALHPHLSQFEQVLWELAEHYGKGSSKYPDGECTCASSTPPGDIVAHQPECPALTGAANWQRGYSWRLSVAALHRHLSQWEQGEDVDAETGSSHLIAAVWHCVALRWFQLHNRGTDYREVKP